MTDGQAELLSAFGVFFLTVILGGIVWGLRLEGKVKQNCKDTERVEDAHNKLADKHDALDEKIVEQFSVVMQSLARIEEKLKSVVLKGS